MSPALLDHLPSREVMARNIVRIIERDAVLAHRARSWYPNTRRYIRHLARCTGYSEYIIASLIAVLSPAVDWRDNWRMALALLRDHDALTFRSYTGNTAAMQGYGPNIRKARLILSTGDATFCRGPKVERFRDAMLGLLDDDAVIDVHATNIALGQVNQYSGPANQNVYDAIVDAYRLASLTLGWHVCEVQSASWTVYKATKPKKVANGQLVLAI